MGCAYMFSNFNTYFELSEVILLAYEHIFLHLVGVSMHVDIKEFKTGF